MTVHEKCVLLDYLLSEQWYSQRNNPEERTSQLLKPGTHYPHVTLAYVMLRVQLEYLTLNSGAHSHFCHSAYVT
jgi:hypothetical protein